MRPSRLFFISLALILSLIFYSPVTAQDGGQDQPYYIVQEGDSLWQIAARFGVPVTELQQANNISDASQVFTGARLVIPGLSGVSGQLDTVTVAYGETLRTLSRRYGLSEATMARLNRLVNPAELYAGARLIVPVAENKNSSLAGRADLTSGQSLLELAVLRGEDPWSLIMENNLQDTWSAVPGDVLRVAGSSSADAPAGLPEAITKIEVDPLLMLQGGTTVVKVYAPPGIKLSGLLADRTLNFFPQEYGYVALQGIYAMTPPGLYPLTLQGELSNGERFAFSQDVLVEDAKFPYDPSLNVDPATLDPAVTGPESKLWASLGAPVSPEKMWNSQFVSPVPKEFTNCWTSLFGNRRSYNGGTYDSFHSGLDFCGQVGTELYAVAPGKVVYTNFLTVRGGVIVIDHGWGVYTAYDHLSKILVQPGDAVQPGQLVGLGGATGRTTGPHLHWEVWVGGVQVNPVDWMQRVYP
ncbi:MAG: peptidoglycan DD-metalloendopeptidase family protein [Chloroflexi bacterium]|nr:peptidoglycan DD-metalloendopeptidase family protein [Chloroflexota bacterium]MBI1854948.1 peptidoglycan DD-metalloendopeptidase family protein [Chloroflexota bacterium]MBI3338984.1 peptidoglycan DD-metalloendopeptidase family protein [Chloroflexota bacterium]